MPGEQCHLGPWPRSVGVLGCATLASAVTRRFLAEFPEQVRISTFGQPSAIAAELQHAGARTTVSPADLAARSQVLVALLRGIEDLERCLAGPSGIEAGVHSPTTLVVSARIEPSALLAVSDRLATATAGRLRLVEASLGEAATEIELGRLEIMAGASSEAYAEVVAVLATLGSVVLVGGLGVDRTPEPQGC